MNIFKNELIQFLDSYADSYSKISNAHICEYGNNKYAHFVRLRYDDYYVELIFTTRFTKHIPKGILIMCISRTTADPFFELGHLLCMLNQKDLRCTWFTNISSTRWMKIALDSLFEIYEDNRDVILSNFEKLTSYRKIEDKYAQEIIDVIELDNKTIQKFSNNHKLCLHYNSSYEVGIGCGFIAQNEFYYAFLSGDYKKAKSFYLELSEQRKILLVEEVIIKVLKKSKADKGPWLISKEYYENYLGFKNNNKNTNVGLRILKYTGVTFAALAIVYASVGLVLRFILSQGTILFYNDIIAGAFLAAGLPMIFGGIAMRNVYEKWFNKKNAQEVIEHDKFVNGKFLDNFSNICFAITLAASIFFCVFSYSQTETFYEDHMKLHGDKMYSYEIHQYEDCDALYLRQGIINPYGDYVKRDSYLLVFKDGSYYDFDGEIENEEFLRSVYPLIKEYTGEIQTIRCPEDLGID